MMDYEHSRDIALVIAALPQQCWDNSITALRKLSYLSKRGALYVEGWAVSTELAFEHGWLELEDGTILDPTYAIMHNQDGTNAAYYRDDGSLLIPEGHIQGCQYEYFPGVRYRLDELKGIRRSQLPLVWRTPGSWTENPAYWEAHVQAYQRMDVDARRQIKELATRER